MRYIKTLGDKRGAICLEKKELPSFLNEAKYHQSFLGAKTYAGENGYVASLPQIIGGGNLALNQFVLVNSEECFGLTPEGKQVVLVMHGIGLVQKYLPKKNFDKPVEISQEDWYNALNGKMLDGNMSPVFSLKNLNEIEPVELPRSFSVLMDLEEAAESIGSHSYRFLLKGAYSLPLFLARCGGPALLEEFLDFASSFFHRINLEVDFLEGQSEVVDFDTPKGNVLTYRKTDRVVSIETDFVGMGESRGFVAVKSPEPTTLIETSNMNLEQLMELAMEFVPKRRRAEFKKKMLESGS